MLQQQKTPYNTMNDWAENRNNVMNYQASLVDCNTMSCPTQYSHDKLR